MIVLDTTVLLYAVGGDHDLSQPCRRIVADVASGSASATTTIEVIQEFAHVRARRRGRGDARDLAREFARLLAPLLIVDQGALEVGLDLFAVNEAFGSFDAVLAATARQHGAAALVSADRAFSEVPGLTHWFPGDWADNWI